MRFSIDRLNDIAFAYAQAAFYTERKKFYHVTLAFIGNKFIEFGVNKNKTHPKLIKLGYNEYSTIHSELDLLIKLKNQRVDTFDLDIYNFSYYYKSLLNNRKKIHNSKPCKHCAAFVFDEFNTVTFYNDKVWTTL